MQRRRLKPEERRLELLQAGERVVRAKGVAATTLDVTRAAGASKATFFVYFPTWEALLLALRERILVQLEAEFSACVAQQPDWRSLVAALPDLFIGMTLDLEGLHPAVLHNTALRREKIAPGLDVVARLTRILQAGAAEGGLDVPDPQTAARFLFANLHHAADLVMAGADRTRTAAAYSQLLVRALEAQPVAVKDLPG